MSIQHDTHVRKQAPTHRLPETMLQVWYHPSQYKALSSNVLSGKIAVVIDVLRATSSHVTALASGASKIYPVETLDDARYLKQANPDWILAGERKGKKPDDFDFGNSPEDYKHLSVSGRSIISTTTNGTQALMSALKAGAEQVIAASLLNLSSVISWLKKKRSPIVIICAGTGSDFSLEDAFVAGTITHKLNIPSPWNSLYRAYDNNPEQLFLSSKNGQALVSLGLKKDVLFCAQQDLYEVVPILNADRQYLAI